MSRKVLILDQFSGVTPFSLDKNPVQFEELCAEMTQQDGQWRGFKQPEIREVEESYQPQYIATTVVAANEQGQAFVWKAYWDTSG